MEVAETSQALGIVVMQAGAKAPSEAPSAGGFRPCPR
jgi:hypothetical protein